MRISDRGVLRSCETLATKSDLSRAISDSRRTTRYVAPRPRTLTTSNSTKAARKIIRARRLVERHPPRGQGLAERHRQHALGALERSRGVHRLPGLVHDGEHALAL